MRNKPKMIKSVFDEGNSIKTNDIVKKIRDYNKIKEKLEVQKSKEGPQPSYNDIIDATLAPKDEATI